MKFGVVDTGGGFRGIYAAGALDYCLDRKINFDLGVGVSAGAANLCSFIAGQKGRNYLFYSVYGLRKEYMSLGNFIRKRSYIDLDYVYGTLSNSNGENPVDYPALRDNPMEFYVAATDAATGRPRYFDKSVLRQDCYDILKASSAIPFVCKPYEIDGTPYYDGALGDPVPIKKAFALGCDYVVLLLTKSANALRAFQRDEKLAAGIQRRYPLAAERLRERARRYNEGVALAREYAAQGKALIVSPDDTCGVDTLTRDREALRRLYQKGYGDGRKIARYIYRERGW